MRCSPAGRAIPIIKTSRWKGIPHERYRLSHQSSRLGADCLYHLLKESLRVAHASGALGEKDMEAVSVDSTVQEKALRFPTDAQLLYTAIVRLGMQARGAGVKLRQSYVRIGRRAPIRPERHVTNPIATVRRAITVQLARTLPRCPCCARGWKRPGRL